MYEIEKGVAPPQNFDELRASYPFEKMEVGDSFFVEMQTSDGRKKVNRLSNAQTLAGMRTGKKFVRRKVQGGYRVWRIV